MCSYFKNFIRRNIPSFIVVPGKKLKKECRRKKLEQQKKKYPVIYRETLANDFLSLGIKAGDNVIVHSSLSKIGYVEGGSKTVIDALLEVIGEEGTLLFPTSPANTYQYYYMKSNPVFDVLHSPSQMGAISEYFRKQEGVVRSFHPLEPVCAKGPLANYFTKDHFSQSTPYNKNSPYYKLIETKGKILSIGVLDFENTCINLHAFDDAIPDLKIPVYAKEEFVSRMIDEKGNEHFMKTKVHDVRYSFIRKPNLLKPLLEKEKVIVYGKIGRADSMLIDAFLLQETLIKYYYEKGITMYTPFGD